MTIATTRAALKAVLETITTTYDGVSPVALTKIYDRPKEATSPGELPCAILALAPQQPHTWSEETGGAVGLLRHDYTIRCWLIVGARQTPIGELTDRCAAWVEPLAKALAANLTLNDAVQHIGGGVDGLASYTETPITWGLHDNEPAWYGLRIDIPVTELISTPMEP